MGNSSQDISSISNTCQSRQGMTSTPVSKGGFPLHSLDASAVTDSQVRLNVPVPKEKIVPTPAGFAKRNKMKCKLSDDTISQGSIMTTYKDKTRNDSFDERLATAEMDLLYAQYLQAAFLESEAKTAVERRSAKSVETLHKLLTLVQLNIDKAKYKRTYRAAQSFLIEFHKHCQKQEEILQPLFEILPTVEKQYKGLAEAVNATKHKLPVENVILPDPDSDEILDVLQKMEEFIASFFSDVPNHKDIVASIDGLQKFINSADLLADALKRGVKLLIEAQELHVSEASLALGCEDL